MLPPHALLLGLGGAAFLTLSLGRAAVAIGRMKQFATDNSIALADGSSRWEKLWRQGIPYMSLEANSINHPDGRGMRLFSDALMALFPGK